MSTVKKAIVTYLLKYGFESKYNPESNEIEIPSAQTTIKPTMREAIVFVSSQGVTQNPPRRTMEEQARKKLYDTHKETIIKTLEAANESKFDITTEDIAEKLMKIISFKEKAVLTEIMEACQSMTAPEKTDKRSCIVKLQNCHLILEGIEGAARRLLDGYG